MRLSVFSFCAILLSQSTVTALAAEPDVRRGSYLFSAAGCQGCHTDIEHKGMIGAGGRELKTPFGSFYGPNITPDKETGIGNWTSAQVLAALQTGVRPDGRLLAPIMPWHAFASLDPQDVRAIAAYLKSLPPVKNKVPGPFGPRDAPTSFVMKIVPPHAPATDGSGAN